MKLLIALLCLASISASASTTAVTATLTDGDGSVWSNCTWSATLNSTTPPTVGKAPVPDSQLLASGSCSTSGVLSATMLNTASVDQAGATWTFTIQPNASVSPSVITGVTTATANLTTVLSAGLAEPRFQSGPNSFGYADIEVGSSAIGSTYFNTGTVCSATGGTRQFSLAGWQCGGGSGSGASNPVTHDLIAEYPFNDGTGTTITDVSGNGRNATFAGGANSPTWLTYGVSFQNSGIISGTVTPQFATTPFSDFKTMIIGVCNPTIGQTTGISTGGQIGNTPILFGPGGGTGGVNFFTATNPSIAVTSFKPVVYRISNGQITADAGFYDGCHVYGYALDASTTDTVMVDGQAIANYKTRFGTGPGSAIIGGTYNFGGPVGGPALRAVITYAIPYNVELTVPEMQQVSEYVRQKLAARGSFPRYPIFTNAVTPQLVYVGDSLTASLQGSAQWTTTLALNYSPTITNWGIGSMQTNDMCYNSYTRWLGNIVPGNTIVHVWGGINDTAQSGVTDALIMQYLGVCAANIKKYGGIPVLATMIANATLDARKNSLGILERANYKQAGFDYLMDYANFPPLGADGAANNNLCFQGDRTHLVGPGAGTCGPIQGASLSGYGSVAAMNSALTNYIKSQYSVGSPRVLTATTGLTWADRAVEMGTLAATSAITLPDCSGLTDSSISINNPQAAQVVTVVGFSASQPINGLTTAITIANNASVTPIVVANPGAVSGCHWSM